MPFAKRGPVARAAAGKMPGASAAVSTGLVAVAGVAVALGVCAAVRLDARVVRTAGGLALVRSVRLPDGERARVLVQGGVYQSATYLNDRRFEPVFAYQRAFDKAFDLGLNVQRALMVGGGGYAWPKHVAVARPDVALDVVEVDPAVTEAARRCFFLDEALALPGVADRLRLVQADGRTFLETRAADASRAPYDLIVNDAFAGADPVRSLATVEAARLVRACLRPGGVYLANVVSRARGADVGFLRDEAATLAQVFGYVHVVPVEGDALAGEDNYLLAATDADVEVPDAVPYDDGFLGTVLRDADDATGPGRGRASRTAKTSAFRR